MKQQQQGFDPNSPVFPPLAGYMKVDLMVNSRGSVWILHEKPLSDIVRWAEYDFGAGTITLAMQTGKIQPLGVKVPKTMAGPLRDATHVSVMLMQDLKIVDFTLVPLNASASY